MRIITLASLLCTFIAAYATPISQEEAKDIAENFLNKNLNQDAPSRKSLRPASSLDKNSQYYIFNAAGGEGFVIVSGDDRTRPILGYSENGNLDVSTLPPQLEFMLMAFSESLESLPETTQSYTSNRQIKRKPIKAPATPLLETQWNQDAPYNNLCPMIGGQKALTGCVATAMGQVINFTHKSNKVEEVPEYWSNDLWMPNLPARTFDYPLQSDDDIASLMLYCGQSVRMEYGVQESGAYVENIPEALHNYFGWESETRVMERGNYNDEHWLRIVGEEIAAAHPIIYSAVTSQGEAHCFVVDGIDGELFHVNWGWGGLADGYYNFSPYAGENKSQYILMQRIISTRDDDNSADIITYGTTIDGINYQLNDEGGSLTAAVLPLKNGEKYRGDLRIPSHVNYEGKTYTVNYFGQNAFVDCAHLTSIFIPATIEGNDWSVFSGCTNLHKVDVEDLLSFCRLEVGGWWTGSPLHNGADLYLNGQIIKDLYIPEGIETLGYCKFSNCTSIESVHFPKSVKSIGQNAFGGCKNLKNVDFSESSVSTIDIQAFHNCESIYEIYLPTTLKEIREDAFRAINGPGVPYLRKVVSLAATPPYSDNAFEDRHYGDAVLYVPDASVESYKTSKEWEMFAVVLPLSEEKPLAEYAYTEDDIFRYEINLTDRYAMLLDRIDDHWIDGHLVIPSSISYDGIQYPVERLGCRALYAQGVCRCDAPLNHIGIAAFQWSGLDDSFKIPSTLSCIPDLTFCNSEFNTLAIPASITKIGHKAFDLHEAYSWDENSVREIECLGAVPPEIEEDTFNPDAYRQILLKVPFGAKKNYACAKGWRNFLSISNSGEEQEEILSSDISLSANFTGLTDVHPGMSLKVEGIVRNSGQQDVDGFDIYWNIDKGEMNTEHFDVKIPAGDFHIFRTQLPAHVDKSGDHLLTLTAAIDKADDLDTSDNTVCLDFTSFDDAYYRVTLIEQFTSEECGLTPWANDLLFEGIESSGNQDFVTHATHHCGFYDDFLTINHDYEWFYNDWGTYTPAVMINRTDMEGSESPVKNLSMSPERDILRESGLCFAQVSVKMEVVENEVVVRTLLEKTAGFDVNDGYDRVTVYLVEDNIPSIAQRDVWTEDGYNHDFIHRNTVRKVMSEIWGYPIEWKGDMCAYLFSSPLNEDWKTADLKAIAFLHRYDPGDVLNSQVYTAGSSDLPQYCTPIDDSLYIDATSGISTGIEPITSEASTSTAVYNLMGVKMADSADQLDRLPAGIYIVNHRLIYHNPK